MQLIRTLNFIIQLSQEYFLKKKKRLKRFRSFKFNQLLFYKRLCKEGYPILLPIHSDFTVKMVFAILEHFKVIL